MTFNSPVRPVTAPDGELRSHLAEAEVPALLMALAQLTGDLAVLDEGYHANGWLFAPQGGLTAQQQRAVREHALAALRRHRDAGSPPVPPPDERTLRAIAGWALGADVDRLVPMLAEELAAPGHDPKAPTWAKQQLAPGRDFRVVVVGAGMSGLLAGHRLLQAGVPVTIYDRHDEVGGTWTANRYPGCRTDVPSHLYNYSFATRSDWPEHFCRWDVMRDYFHDFAKHFGVLDHVVLGAEVRSARWDEAAARWRVRVDTRDGVHDVDADVLVSAVGQLSRPHVPDIPGRETFAGPAFHSAAWDPSVDLAGRRVAAVGTGASAFQFVPEVAGEAAELLVFQRTPPWLRPTPHYHAPVSDGARWLHEHVPHYSLWHRFWLLAPGIDEVLAGWVVDPDHPPTETAVSARNDALRAALTAAIESQLADAPHLREHVVPRYPVGAKRVLRDNGVWLETLKRPDVTLVTDAIAEVVPEGLRTVDGALHRADVILWGTGFEASRFLVPMTVTGVGGADLHETWGGSARAYLGATVPGFPNLFCLYGPNTNLSGQGGSIVYFSECAVTYLVDAVRHLLATGASALDVRPEVHDAYNSWVDEGNANRAWGFSDVNTWAFDRRAGRSAQNWPFSPWDYWSRTRRLAPADYLIT
jgi:4-hydroxyacetophenone monooxygenase